MGTAYHRSDYGLLDLTRHNPALSGLDAADLPALESYMDRLKKRWGCSLLWGGYAEKRFFYDASDHFSGRNVHLGVDVWAPAGTPVYAPMDGVIHSQAYNDNYRDYGATILVQHQHDGREFVSLYGHLSAASLTKRQPGERVRAGEQLAELGDFHENGGWPPHLHLQWIRGPIPAVGDFPGVCASAGADQYLEQCPNPAFLVFGGG